MSVLLIPAQGTFMVYRSNVVADKKNLNKFISLKVRKSTLYLSINTWCHVDTITTTLPCTEDLDHFGVCSLR